MNSKKIGPIVLAAIMVFFFLVVMPVSAEVIELWNRSYDGGDDDRALGVATDASGNVIVTGMSFDGSTWNYYTIKYDTDGNELWNRSYDSGGVHADDANGVATDASGNVIVTGKSFDESTWNHYYYTIKYDTDGNELWNRSYDSGHIAEAYGVATDASGNVIVTGWSNDGSSTWNYYTIKYDTDGNELWNRSYDGGYTDRASGVATDASGNVIVTGWSFDGSTFYHYYYYTIKYDTDGYELWNRSYDGDGACANGVATDAYGNVIVTGMSFYGSTYNYYTIKYDTDGYELWNRSYDGGDGDWASGVATDASGNVIVTGRSSDGSTWNYYTIKYGVSTEVPTEEVINSYIQGLPDEDFKQPADLRKNTLSKKLANVSELIDAGQYQEAIDKLKHDIRAKADGFVDGNPKDDWIRDPEAQEEICTMIDDLIAYLETLL